MVFKIVVNTLTKAHLDDIKSIITKKRVFVVYGTLEFSRRSPEIRNLANILYVLALLSFIINLMHSIAQNEYLFTSKQSNFNQQ